MENQTMQRWNKVLTCASLAFLLVAIGCTKKADIAGNWSGSLDGTEGERHATSNIQAVLEDSRHGVDGTVTWHNSTGPWGLMEGETLEVRSGKISGENVAFMAEKSLPGGTVSANFKGVVSGTEFKGTVDVNIGSVMGGDTYLGNFELARK
jgi:hypothetical protein